MATKDQALEDHQGDGVAHRLRKTRTPVIQMLASGVFGTVMAATGTGLIVDHLPKTIQIPAFICLLVVLAPTLSATVHWFLRVGPERIEAEIQEEHDKLGYGRLNEDDREDDSVKCPKCRSVEVVFDSREHDGSEVEPEAAREDSNITGAAMLAAINGRTMASRNSSNGS